MKINVTKCFLQQLKVRVYIFVASLMLEKNFEQNPVKLNIVKFFRHFYEQFDLAKIWGAKFCETQYHIIFGMVCKVIFLFNF